MQVSKSAKIPAVTTGSGPEANQSILLTFLHCKDCSQARSLSHSCVSGRPCNVSIRGSPTLKCGLNADLQNLGHNTVGRIPSISRSSGAAEAGMRGCTCRVSGVTAGWDAAPVALGRREPGAGGGRTLSYTRAPTRWKSHPTLSQLDRHPSTHPSFSANCIALRCFLSLALVYLS